MKINWILGRNIFMAQHIKNRVYLAILFLSCVSTLKSVYFSLKQDTKHLDMTQLTTLDISKYADTWRKEFGIVPLIIPLGATEQHGPIGLLGTDAITAEAVSMGVCTRMNTLLLPVFSYGMSLHHCGFSGSVSLRPSTYAHVIEDIITSLTLSSGFTHFYFLNGHGGNIMPAKLGIETIALKYNISSRTTGDSINDGVLPYLPQIRLNSWFAEKNVSTLAKSLFHDQLGQHATPDEISLTQYLFDALPITDGNTINTNLSERYRNMTQRRNDLIIGEQWTHLLHAEELTSYQRLQNAAMSYMDRHDFKSRYPDGRMMSNSFLARPEYGKLIYETAVDAVTEDLRLFLGLKP